VPGLHYPSRGEHDSLGKVHLCMPHSSYPRSPCECSSDASMSVTKFRSALASALQTAPAVLTLIDPDVVGRQQMSLPQRLGISERRILRRSILGNRTTVVLLVEILPPLPSYGN
jgi:hypothetical protein